MVTFLPDQVFMVMTLFSYLHLRIRPMIYDAHIVEQIKLSSSSMFQTLAMTIHDMSTCYQVP